MAYAAKKAFSDNIADDISDADMKNYYEAYKSAAAEKAKMYKKGFWRRSASSTRI
ncbi:hypothetical protein I6J17_13920 [Heyndrickxia coagulans]|uniref:hypothetical protein n=1 Tax=Heyndrickxia coagulans TaxID=1398 RepID=UPI00030F5C61|nr:hypothetical protein [Heyndrickxia coagulans]QQS91976.1 hypothetical protein I6J17_13920 [Heyndrickxia coagulans]UYM83525.1 hypothetical protein OF848_06400 [Heyndrickxia coagulans]